MNFGSLTAGLRGGGGGELCSEACDSKACAMRGSDATENRVAVHKTARRCIANPNCIFPPRKKERFIVHGKMHASDRWYKHETTNQTPMM